MNEKKTFELEKQLNILIRVAEKLKNGLLTSGNIAHDGKIQGYTIENVVDNIRKILTKPNDEFVFKSIPRLLEMIESSSRSISYAEKLADTLEGEDYQTDAKIVRENIKTMKGEMVPMATMDQFEAVLADEWKGYNYRGAAAVDALEDNTQELAFAKGFYRGWKHKCDTNNN